MKKDISNRKDIEILIQSFYSTLTQNDEMKLFFEKVDFKNHLPRMCDFWEFIVFNTNGHL
jgi:hemoglobin